MRPLVLCYHGVSPAWVHRLALPPSLLLQQVRTLARFRRLHITFDDAFRNAGAVLPALQQLGFPIQLFVCTEFARDGAPLTIPELATEDPDELAQLATMNWDEVRELADRGIEVSSHTVSHPHLTSLSDSEIRHELAASKDEIETELRRPCNEFAYPYGEHDERVRALVRTTGYTKAYALRGRPNDPYAVPRLDLYRRHNVARTILRSFSPLR